MSQNLSSAAVGIGALRVQDDWKVNRSIFIFFIFFWGGGGGGDVSHSFWKCPHFFKGGGTLCPILKFLGRTLIMLEAFKKTFKHC